MYIVFFWFSLSAFPKEILKNNLFFSLRCIFSSRFTRWERRALSERNRSQSNVLLKGRKGWGIGPAAFSGGSCCTVMFTQTGWTPQDTHRNSDIERNSTNKCIYALSILVGKHHEPQSINGKLFLPIIPIGIVAYAFTLLWDNLCRNSRGASVSGVVGHLWCHARKLWGHSFRFKWNATREFRCRQLARLLLSWNWSEM